MAGFRPVALYGLTVPPGEDPVPAFGYESYPATFKLTMAALDPFAKAEQNETTADVKFTGATLKVIRIPNDDTDSEDEDDDDAMDLLNGLGDDDEDSDEDEEEDEDVTGGPSDLSKSAKARKIAALREALAEAEDMDVDASPKLSAKAKGKAKAAALDANEDLEEDEEDDDEDSDEGDVDEIYGPEEFVLCTLDPSKNYQQTLDITINEYETVYFQVSGTHAVHLTGNIMVPDEGDDYDEDDEEESEDEYDLSPDEDELDLPDSDDESDELDDIDDPRVTELVSDEEADAPKLVAVAAPAKKGKNKRAAPDSADTSMVDDVPAPAAVPLDEVLAKALKPDPAANATNGEAKLSKKQKKKLKSNAGLAVDAPASTAAKEDVGEAIKASPGKGDKKVQFSKPIIQGPTASTSSPDVAPTKGAKVNGEAKAAAGPKMVQGVEVDDKKTGSGPAAKKGSKVSMRYIGKLFDTKAQFDSNKKGKPFTFTLGAGDVIKGWDIGVAGMQVGGERRITIPAHLAYGSKGLPGIPANSKLVFDVKLLEIK